MRFAEYVNNCVLMVYVHCVHSKTKPMNLGSLHFIEVNAIQCSVTHCNSLQQVATHCNTQASDGYCDLAWIRRSLSSAIVNRTPLPRGSDTHGLLPLPMTNTLFSLRSNNKHNYKATNTIIKLTRMPKIFGRSLKKHRKRLRTTKGCLKMLRRWKFSVSLT